MAERSLFVAKKRGGSQPIDKQHHRQILPFIKPRYMQEQMFNSSVMFQHLTRPSDSSEASKITDNVSRQNTRNKEEISDISQSFASRKESVLRYRIELNEQKPKRHRLKLATLPSNQDSDSSESTVERGMRYPFVQRRHKRTSTHHPQAEMHEPGRDETIYQGKYYVPVLYKQAEVEEPQKPEETQQVYKMGRIKKQILPIKRVTRKAIDIEQTKKKVRKAMNVVLFIVYLKRYSRLYRQSRRKYLQKLGQDGVKQRFLELKRYFIKASKPFFQSIVEKHDFSFQVNPKDIMDIRQRKAQSVKKLTSLLLECIYKGIQEMKDRNYMGEIIYSLCKHASYGNQWKLHTTEEFDISCLSQEEGYIRSDSFLEKSAIISLLFIKIILFNLLLNPEAIPLKINPLLDRQKVNNNIRLIGNILYELMITEQDDLLEKCDNKFIIGNWRNLHHKFPLIPAHSMTIHPSGQLQKNELISGLAGHTLIRDLYQIDKMEEEERQVRAMVQLLHQNMIKFHYKYRQNYL